MGLFDADQDAEQEDTPDGDELPGMMNTPNKTPTRMSMPLPTTPPPMRDPAPGWQGGVAGLFDRAEEGIKGGLSAAGDRLMPTPTALKGLLSPDDISTARQQGLLHLGIALSQGRGENPLQSLGRGLEAAQGAFADHVSSVITQKKLADEEQQRQMTLNTQRALLSSRAQIAQQFQAAPNETAAQTDDRLRKMAVAYANSNDPDMATKVGTLMKDLRAPSLEPHSINLGDRVVTTDVNGKTIRTDPVNENPAQVQRDKVAATRANSADARAQAASDRFDQTQKQAQIRQQNTIVHDFNKTAEDYHAAESGYSVLKAAKESPNNFMQPMAALDALARMLNPKGAVRVGTLQILKSQGSLGDRIERNLSMLKSGKWPDSMQKDVFDMADKIMSEHTEDFETARQEAIDRGDAQGVDVRALLHKSQTIKNTSSAPSGAGVRQFLKKSK